MNTRYIAAEYRLAHWAQIMRDRLESGLSIKAFCKNTGIHENTYFYWQKKLRVAACEQLAKTQANSTPPALTHPGFTEVELRDSHPPVQDSKTILHGNLFIEVSDVKLTADCGYPVAQLAYLLRELVKQC
jgi:hypothetical protein